ncbi:MAG: GNAT family N-acetyltransferase [Bacteroidales bacterium]|jgi:ribosomal protein S18 acetylase RimI-like enzyme|nr:GNAT family N-acetyltransferase [Bacteroidales bacterium]
MNKSLLRVDLSDEEHAAQVVRLLDAYMRDAMGLSAPMPVGLAPRIIAGLRQHSGYIGFFALCDGQYAGLANCNRNFSTFKARPLLNIHDLIVLPEFRRQGVGRFLLDALSDFCRQNGYCRISLEVRTDNSKAQALYRAAGFADSAAPALFWEKIIDC